MSQTQSVSAHVTRTLLLQFNVLLEPYFIPGGLFRSWPLNVFLSSAKFSPSRQFSTACKFLHISNHYSKSFPFLPLFFRFLNRLTICSTRNAKHFIFTGQASTTLAWYINGLLVPELTLKRGLSYKFLVRGGNNPHSAENYHPLIITDEPHGGYDKLTEADKSKVRVLAGVEYSRRGKPQPTSGKIRHIPRRYSNYDRSLFQPDLCACPSTDQHKIEDSTMISQRSGNSIIP